MAEEFQGGVCGGNWAWTSSRNLFGSSPCSLASNDVFVWPNHDDDVTRLMEMKDARSSDDSDGGGSVVIQKPAADGGMSVAEMMGDWNQDLLNDSGGSHQNYSSFHLMNPNMNYQHQHQHQTKVDDHHHQDFPQINSIQPNFPPLNTFSSSYNSLLQTLFDTDSDQPQEMNNYANYQPGFLPNFHKTTSPTVNQLAPAWSAAAAARSTFLPSTQSHYLPPSALTNKRPNLPSFGDNKHHHEQVKESNSVAKKSGSEPGYKRPRIETPSPLPTFKVRKEKLGDRITALQQLVSPFGKTDTASVLHEAIEYIKFLHDQVNALSTPYLKYGSPPLQRQQVDKSRDEQGLIKDLNSRGLCLVPISSTFPVAAETPSDFWTPTFGGNLK